MKETFAGKIRAAAKALPKSGFRAEELSEAAGLATYKERDVMRRTIHDMVKRGEMVRLGGATYSYVGRSGPPQMQLIMWRFLRSGRSFGGVTIEELREASGASEEYAREWLGLLTRRGMVKEMKSGKYQLVCDPGVEMPVNDEKAEKLRRIREKKKQSTIQALERAGAAIAQAIEFVRGAE